MNLQFFKTRQGKPNEIRIPKYMRGEPYNVRVGDTDISKLSKRNNVGNREIDLIGARKPDVRPRFSAKFKEDSRFYFPNVMDKPPVYDGFKQYVKANDPTDFAWLAERARMAAEIRARYAGSAFTAEQITAIVNRELAQNKPLGRPQRTVTLERGDADLGSVTLNRKLDAIERAIAAGRADNDAGRIQIAADLANILAQITDLQNISQEQQRFLVYTISSLKLTADYNEYGLPREVDDAFYTTNKGVVNLYLLARASIVLRSGNVPAPNYGLDRPVLSIQPSGLRAVGLRTLVSALRTMGRDRYLDLQDVIIKDRNRPGPSPRPLPGLPPRPLPGLPPRPLPGLPPGPAPP